MSEIDQAARHAKLKQFVKRMTDMSDAELDECIEHVGPLTSSLDHLWLSCLHAEKANRLERDDGRS